jgi:hypothetical protein
MDSTKLALMILTSANSPLPGEVATELLSAIPADELPNSLLNFKEFSGKNMAAVARSSTKKAKLIAENTSDTETQRAIVESKDPMLLTAMLSSKKIKDNGVLIDIHRFVWEEKYDDYSLEKVRPLVATAVPLEYQLDYLLNWHHNDHTPVSRRYDLRPVGAKIGHAIVKQDYSSLQYVSRIVERFTTKFSYPEELMESIGRTMAFNMNSEELYEALCKIESILPTRETWEVVETALNYAKPVTKDLLLMQLRYMQTPEEFKDYIIKCTTNNPSWSAQMAPSCLITRQGSYTLEALKVLADVFPGALAAVAEKLSSQDEGFEKVVDLVLYTNESDVVRNLLGRNSMRSGDTLDKSVFNKENFHKALDVFCNGHRRLKTNAPLSPLESFAAARSIPEGADVHDVANLMKVSVSPVEVVKNLFSSSTRKYMSYTPTPKELKYLISIQDQALRPGMVDAVLQAWGFYQGHSEMEADVAILEDLLEAVIDMIPASEIPSFYYGTKYLTHLCSKSLGSNPEKWLQAIGLIPSAQVGISKVLLAANRLV